MPPTLSGNASSKSSLPALHHQQLLETERFVLRRLHLSSSRGIEPLCMAVLLELRRSGEVKSVGGDRQTPSTGTGVSRDAYNAALERCFEQVIRQHESVLWLVTQALICLEFDRRNSSRERTSGQTRRGDQLHDATQRALAKLEGGHQPLRAFSAGEPHDGERSFWRFLQRCVRNAVVDQVRPQSFFRGIFSRDVAISDEFDEDEQGFSLSLSDPSPLVDMERVMVRLQRRSERERTIRIIRDHAVKEAQKGDPNAQLALEYMDWLAGRSDSEPSAQTDFARARGLPPGTVNSALYRFRKSCQRKEISPDFKSLGTTQGGHTS